MVHLLCVHPRNLHGGMKMMFFFHTVFSLELLTLCAGAALYIWSLRNHGAGILLAKILGLLVIVLSLISVICTSYTNFTMWQAMRGHEPMMLQGMSIADKREEMKIEKHENKKHERKKKEG